MRPTSWWFTSRAARSRTPRTERRRSTAGIAGTSSSSREAPATRRAMSGPPSTPCSSPSSPSANVIEAVQEDPRGPVDEKGGLKRILGVGFGLAVIVGSTLGIGILRTPGLVAGQVGSRSGILAVWLVGGLYTLLGSVCLTELGAMLPHAVGFAVGWSDWITYGAVLGYVTIAMGEFSAVLVPSWAPAVKPIAVGVLVFFALLQWAGVRICGRFQAATTAIKSLAFLALVAACFAHAA